MLDLICHPKRSADFNASSVSCLKKVEDSPLTFGLKHMINCQLLPAAIMDHNVLFNQVYKQIDIIQPLTSLITLTNTTFIFQVLQHLPTNFFFFTFDGYFQP